MATSTELEAGSNGTRSPGHIALLLFRKLTQAEDYLEALRRHDIQYIIDGEKHFYRRQEVIDPEHPLHREIPTTVLVLVGLLRSPIGPAGFRLVPAQAGDYRNQASAFELDEPHAQSFDGCGWSWRGCDSAAPCCPLPQVMGLCFSSALPRAGCGLIHGEQAVAKSFFFEDTTDGRGPG